MKQLFIMSMIFLLSCATYKATDLAGKGTIIGVVRDLNSEGYQGLIVELMQCKPSIKHYKLPSCYWKAVAVSATDASGYYHFENVKDGWYFIFAELPGRDDYFERMVEMWGAQTIISDFVPQDLRFPCTPPVEDHLFFSFNKYYPGNFYWYWDVFLSEMPVGSKHRNIQGVFEMLPGVAGR